MRLSFKIIGAILLLIVAGLVLYLSLKDYKISTLYESRLKNAGDIVKDELGNGGKINYLSDDFCSYEEYSASLDQMEDLETISVSGAAREVQLSDNNYGGDKSLKFLMPKNSRKQTVIKGVLASDLGRWASGGVYSAWIHLESHESVQSVSLSLVSQSGTRHFTSLENILTEEENKIQSDDIFPDYYLPEKDGESHNKWEDFMLSNGWNYLFWRADEYSDEGEFDISKVESYQMTINYYEDRVAQNINLDNLRVSDGLQRNNNSLAGNWFAPNGMPQYGVFDTEKKGDDCFVRLLNVRQEQYPSNGDHVRILSKRFTPENFVVQIEFEAIKYQPQPIKNSYFRFQYDFEKTYAPGHDWFGAFISLEYENFGLISVDSIERYYIQEQEPKEPTKQSRQEFVLDFQKRYKLNLEVNGQDAKAIIYEVLDSKIFNYRKIRKISYTFDRQRELDGNRPFSIEATGAYHMNLYEVNILALE